MRPIDADALKYRREEYGGHDDVPMEARRKGILYLLKEDIDEAPTIDAVPVVRCKDCKRHNAKAGKLYRCDLRNVWQDGDFFCANGERSEE